MPRFHQNTNFYTIYSVYYLYVSRAPHHSLCMSRGTAPGTHRRRKEGGIRQVALDERALLDALHAVQPVQDLAGEVRARMRLL